MINQVFLLHENWNVELYHLTMKACNAIFKKNKKKEVVDSKQVKLNFTKKPVMFPSEMRMRILRRISFGKGFVAIPGNRK